MKYIRLKGNFKDKTIADRLQYNPEILEFYTADTDLEQPDYMMEQIRMLKQRGIKVYLHHPVKHRGNFLDIMSRDPGMAAYYMKSCRQLADLCEAMDIHCVVHAHYQDTESSLEVSKESTRRMRDSIARVREFAGDRFLWEDSIEGIFSYANPYLLEELIAPLNLPLTVDVSHTFISFRGDNASLERVLADTRPYARYYHVVDSMGLSHDSLPLGEGKINWRMVKPYVADRDFIFEIGLKGDHSDCTPMVESAAYFCSI